MEHMNHDKYTEIPTGRKQMLGTTAILIAIIGYLYFANPNANLGEDMRRFMNRTGGVLILYATILGAWGYLWSKKNKKKGEQAALDIAEYTESIRRLTKGQQNLTQIGNVLQKLKENKEAAERAKEEVSRFDDDVAYVAIGALVFVAIGTICQMLAA